MKINEIDNELYEYLLRENPLFHSGWIKFNEQKWNLKHDILCFCPDKGNSWKLYILFYYNSKNKIVVPPRNPYLPSIFICDSRKICEINSRTRAAYEKLVNYLSRKNINRSFIFCPKNNDVRAFTWNKYIATPLYSYIINLKNYRVNLSSNLKTKINKAHRKGYYCEECSNFSEIVRCLSAPEERKGFKHLLFEEDYITLNNLMTRNNFISFVVKNSEGKIKGAWVQIYSRELVLAWSAGIESDALSDGVNFLLGDYVLNFFEEQGCKRFDLVGANIPPVAKMKEAWGGELVTYYKVSKRNVAFLGKEIILFMRSIIE